MSSQKDKEIPTLAVWLVEISRLYSMY